jgi:hypothetical protein
MIPPLPSGVPPTVPGLEKHLVAREKGRSCLRILFMGILVTLAVVAIAVGGCFLLIFTLN